MFSAERTLTLTFPSSGVKEVSRYARGVLVVYNAYSSEPQPLVAQTRFQTADGKIFRLAKSVVVPAAKITEGKIQPSSIETEVVADKPGAEYNAGPTPYLSVPGFRNTPKYQGFYGEIRASFSGGFVGTVAVPTEGDIRKAKTEVKEKLENAMIAALQTEIPKEFKLIDGARTFRLLQEGVTEEADASGNFGVTSRGSMHMVAFREATVNNAMEAKMKKEFGENYLFSESTVGYREARADFTAGSLAFTIDFKGVAVQPVDAAAIKNAVAGMNEEDLRATLSAVPGLERAEVLFWPFWVKRVPRDARRVTVDIQQ